MKLSRTGGIKPFFFLPTTKNVASGEKVPAAQNDSQEKEKKSGEAFFIKSIWVGATYLWHSGTQRKQHFNKWKSFSIKSSAHGRQSLILTEGSESLPALCAISVPGLSLNPGIRYLL